MLHWYILSVFPGMTPKKANKPTQEDDLDYLVRRLEDMQPGTPKEQVPDAEPPVTPVKKKKMNPEVEPERDVNPGQMFSATQTGFP